MASVFKRNKKGPWIVQWFDHTGKRREKSSRTTDKRAADRIANQWEADAALRREGVIDARKDRYSIEGRKPLSRHVEDYLQDCRQTGQSSGNIVEKERHLARFLEETGVTRLTDLTADVLSLNMGRMIDAGYSARSANFRRQVLVAFMNWCKKAGRIEENPLAVVAKLDERNNRRRIRRPLADDELARLLAVAEERGRKAWYLAAALAGLRKGDLQRLKWADVDFDKSTITVRDGKAKRTDVLPMHPQLAEELQKHQATVPTSPKAKVFPQTVTDRTRLKDFLRAGLAREDVVKDQAGEPVMIGKGKRRRPKTRIVVEDAEGRVIDLHSMRTTLGTNLAREGIAPQLAQRIMRHSDYRTTQQHYMVLDLSDTQKVMAGLPRIPSVKLVTAGRTGVNNPQQIPQQLEHDLEQNGAKPCDEDEARPGDKEGKRIVQVPVNAGLCGSVRDDATISEQPAGVTQLVECQPSKLNVAGSTPVARFESKPAETQNFCVTCPDAARL